MISFGQIFLSNQIYFGPTTYQKQYFLRGRPAKTGSHLVWSESLCACKNPLLSLLLRQQHCKRGMQQEVAYWGTEGSVNKRGLSPCSNSDQGLKNGTLYVVHTYKGYKNRSRYRTNLSQNIESNQSKSTQADYRPKRKNPKVKTKTSRAAMNPNADVTGFVKKYPDVRK